ncbi:unannotated protein [freshwater metagenome]|uniref:Unannotated protein n=1 Tax=freshwater metagenome TaxID=449393 RepID=A0A6J7IH76_9ZZZZ
MLVATLLEFCKPVATAHSDADGQIVFSSEAFREIAKDRARIPGMVSPRLGRHVGLADGDEFLRALPSAINSSYRHRNVTLTWQRLARTPADSLVDGITIALGSRWTSISEVETHLPQAPGLYAVWVDWRGWEHLRRVLPDGFDYLGGPLYIGKSESSLRGRDARTHFRAGKTGHSTLRRSIAALLHQLDDVEPLRAQPRNLKNPERFANFALDEASEDILQTWIERHLSIGWWTPTDETSGAQQPPLGDLERALIAHQLWGGIPPLNLKDLDGQPTAAARPIKDARRILAQQAEAWPNAPADPIKPAARERKLQPLDGSVPDPDDPRRIWLDGWDHPEAGDIELAAMDIRLAAAIATGHAPNPGPESDPNEDAVRVFRRADRTILLCLDGQDGHIGAQVAADILDLDLSSSAFDLQDEGYLVALLSKVSKAVRTESAEAGRPRSRCSAAIAVVEGGLIRWASVGRALIALVDPDGTLRRLGTPQPDLLGQPTIPDERAAFVETGLARLWPGGWLVLASDGLTTFAHDWSATILESALVRTHYPANDFRRGINIPMASAVARDLIDAAHAGGARGAVSAVVLGRETFSDLPRDEEGLELAAWLAEGRGY